MTFRELAGGAGAMVMVWFCFGIAESMLRAILSTWYTELSHGMQTIVYGIAGTCVCLFVSFVFIWLHDCWTRGVNVTVRVGQKSADDRA